MAIPAIFIPAMSMPFIFIALEEGSWRGVCREWQSEFIQAKVHEISHAAANEETESSRSTTEPANMRFGIMPLPILCQTIIRLQSHVSGNRTMQKGVRAPAAECYLLRLFSAQTYS